MAVDNKKIAEDVLAAVGGIENVSNVTHCMTRLRFTLKDNGIPDIEKVKKLKGVIGAQMSGGQFQVIIGQNVPKVYDEVCAMGGFTKHAAIDENLDAPKEKLTPKVIGNNILNYLSGSIAALIPLFMAGGLFRTFAVVIGPTLLNLVSAEDPTYLLFNNYLFDAAMYFLPIYLGYSAAKKLGASPALGMMMGGVLISPGIVQLATDGGELVVYGIHIQALNYSQSVLPILLSVAALYFVEKAIKRVMPDVLSTIFTPFCTMVIMVPVALVVLAPIGNELGNVFSMFLYGIADMGGIGYLIAMGIVGAFWQLFVITGMHGVIIMPAMVTLLSVGSDKFIFVASNIAMVAVWGMVLGSALRLRNKDEKSLAWGYFVAALAGGVTEPALYGLLLRFRRTIPPVLIGGAIGGVLAGILGCTAGIAGGSSNLLYILAYLQEGTGNLVCMVISSVVAFVIAAVLTFMFGFSKEELAEMDEENLEAIEA